MAFTSLAPNKKQSRLKMALIGLITMLYLMSMIPETCSLPALIRVCGARELKEVTESICSTLGKRDFIPFGDLVNNRSNQRVKSECIVFSN